MSSTVHVGSAGQFRTMLSSSSIVVTDFYADWCGPCKAIAPVFEQLSKKHSKPKSVTFAKVNVDSQQEIARQYGVSAMPTFLIFRNGSVIQTIRGADQRQLSQAVENAVKMAGPAKPVYSSVGRTLGGAPTRGQSLNKPWISKGFLQAIITFFGLYLVSLFSLDAYGAAQNSYFNINRVDQPTQAPAKKGERTGAATQIGKKLGTISDLRSD